MSKQRIAIVGAGVSGLSAAWALDQAGFEVVVYEKDEVFGGHAQTLRVDSHPDKLLVDPGVQVISPPIFPHIIAMTRMFGVGLIPYPVGFTLRSELRGLCGVNHQRSDWWREIEPECVRFTIEMSELMSLRAAEVISCSLGEYFTSRGYSQAFIEFMALVAAIIGPQQDEEALETSVVVFATVLSSGFLSLIANSSHEMAFEGGVTSLVHKLAEPVAAHIRLGCGVASIHRSANEVRVVDDRGRTETFDQIILCVDGQLALTLLAEPTPLEENLLSSCQMKAYASIIHTDASVLLPDIDEPRRTYLEIDDGFMTGNLSVINVEKRELSSPLLLSYERIPLDGGAPDTPAPIDPSQIRHRYEFRQTKDNTYAFEVKKNLFRIQGQQRTWFASAWTTMSTLEHAVVSGLVIAEALGASYPFASDAKAAPIYAAYKAMMLQGTEDFPLSAL